ncbi:citrinin biosynthesis oxydoreductase CtnB, partial [Metarhizium brunneum ARSEF 3297]
MTVDDTLSLPRILCLHGGGVNGTVFRLQCRAIIAQLGHRFRFVFMDAPYTSRPHRDIVTVYGDFAPFYRWLAWSQDRLPLRRADGRQRPRPAPRPAPAAAPAARRQPRRLQHRLHRLPGPRRAPERPPRPAPAHPARPRPAGPGHPEAPLPARALLHARHCPPRRVGCRPPPARQDGRCQGRRHRGSAPGAGDGRHSARR